MCVKFPCWKICWLHFFVRFLEGIRNRITNVRHFWFKILKIRIMRIWSFRKTRVNAFTIRTGIGLVPLIQGKCDRRSPILLLNGVWICCKLVNLIPTLLVYVISSISLLKFANRRREIERRDMEHSIRKFSIYFSTFPCQYRFSTQHCPLGFTFFSFTQPVADV